MQIPYDRPIFFIYLLTLENGPSNFLGANRWPADFAAPDMLMHARALHTSVIMLLKYLGTCITFRLYHRSLYAFFKTDLGVASRGLHQGAHSGSALSPCPAAAHFDMSTRRAGLRASAAGRDQSGREHLGALRPDAS